MLQIKELITPVDCIVTENTTLVEAISLMNKKKWNLLPVSDVGRKLVGVFTRSSLFQMVLDEKPLTTPIKKYIKAQVKTLPINTPYEKIELIVKNSQVGTGVIIDEHDQVVGILTKTDMVMSLLQTSQELKTVKTLKRTLETALDHAYDGIVMTDEKKNILMVSPPLLELFNLQLEAVLYHPVAKVLPELQLDNVYQSETAEVSEFLEINGIKYIVHRIPIQENGRIIGAIGKVVFRQLNEVSELFKKLQKAENKASFYHQQFQKSESARFTWDHLLTVDPYMEKLKKSAAKAAKGRSTILIRGESGTGKELFAQAIHNSSARNTGKFIVVNCAAIPEDLLESEFFGYDEGAFTGARQKGKLGKFDLANGGTLFLDEVGDMSLSLQAKLLRVLQEREFYRVGGTVRIQVDVRIIAATNRNLEEMVQEGLFREDLYYRLNVISLNVPPLRDRLYDTDHLIGRFMIELNQILGTSITGIEDRARGAMLDYAWPGNVRELRNVMERAMTFAENGKIRLEDLPDYLVKQVSVVEPSLNVSLVENAELEAIKKALVQVQGNKVKAARLLGISRSGLYEKIKKYKLPT
ncbi:sigma 54-interacting transcriptional regulator [Bacillus sp. ISL-40]|uniref:sigma-54-dependent Fis family transcriptional regulator n=1 Tax=unclassified Bacillus (in: firmicutes) TaxID=185979 RepID=UPI001BE61E5A|nr:MULTISPECIES: sigma-54-dependent Fis family transcriptional regulator [unclassified Bacillus (in: firmicutes)]MBT2697354.1 sigma 54-interacting transcriptional regulator [Bacillus sp. ISL-40]MBT2723853.1 sigma 54-interacting transcriptional regulator [Bacillus sp. ISL-46]MBT2741829.1 sigma 54-interacting transcriptional regulator [Bacillus sp. ISL-77]